MYDIFELFHKAQIIDVLRNYERKSLYDGQS